MAKSVAKKSTKKPVVVKVIKTRKPNALHDKLIKLFSRPNGATITDVGNAGFKYSAIAALKIAERRGYKVNVKKQPGELTCYFAKKA
jgi:hypothetical protein